MLTVAATYLLVDIPCREVGFQPVLRVLVRVVVSETTLFLHLVIFVVASINDNRRMMTDTFDLGNTFGLDGIPKLFDRSRIVSTAEHEVLPYEDAELVTDFIEDILFPDTTAPDPGGSISGRSECKQKDTHTLS